MFTFNLDLITATFATTNQAFYPDFLVHLYDHFDTRLTTPPSPDTTTKPLALSQFFGFGYMITIQVD